jgi:type II secretory pathway pseudopilin PulG
MKPFSKKGFTLVEMLLYVAICSVILISLTTFLSFLLNASVKNQTIAEVEHNGLQVLQLMTQTIRNGKGINTPILATSSSTLSIKTVATTTDPILFDLASGTLRIKEGASGYIPLTSGRVIISSLMFKNTSASSTDGGSVDITFIVSYLNQSGTNEYSFSKTFNGTASFH